MSMVEEIAKLKQEKDVVILAHYYVDGAVQEIADFVGDSYYLAKIATKVTQSNILFCGVKFMGESAKILNPQKHVYMADDNADCPMAHMVKKEKIAQVREMYGEDVEVVTYVNSTAEIKTVSDVCVTSSNALCVVTQLKAKHLYFIPDHNLGQYIAEQLPEKHFILNDGYCHVHKSITLENLLKAKEAKPNAIVLSHPECTMDVLAASDFVGSTSEIIDYAKNSSEKEFIICTEMGVFYNLMKDSADKKFYSVGHRQFCPNMKKVTLDKVLYQLQNLNDELTLDAETIEKASRPLQRMLELAK